MLIEWGPQRSSIPKIFHPDYPDIAWPAWKAAVIAPLETLIRDQARSQVTAIDRG
jgi:hypothetical protein